jgi:hypothetical protein
MSSRGWKDVGYFECCLLLTEAGTPPPKALLEAALDSTSDWVTERRSWRCSMPPTIRTQLCIICYQASKDELLFFSACARIGMRCFRDACPVCPVCRVLVQVFTFERCRSFWCLTSQPYLLEGVQFKACHWYMHDKIIGLADKSVKYKDSEDTDLMLSLARR